MKTIAININNKNTTKEKRLQNSLMKKSSKQNRLSTTLADSCRQHKDSTPNRMNISDSINKLAFITGAP